MKDLKHINIFKVGCLLNSRYLHNNKITFISKETFPSPASLIHVYVLKHNKSTSPFYTVSFYLKWLFGCLLTVDCDNQRTK